MKCIKAFWFRSETNFKNRAKTYVIEWEQNRVDIHTRVLTPLSETMNLTQQGYKPLRRFKTLMLMERTVHINRNSLYNIAYGLFSEEEVYSKL
jgi:hypothetical protein